MDLDRRKWLALMALTGAAQAVASDQPQRPAVPDLYRTDDPKTLLTAARLLLEKDTIGTLITVDAAGQPRARSILISAPDDDLTLWMGTRPGSRKLEQIAEHPQATIYCNDDATASYVTLMGHAHVEREAAVIAAKNPYRGEMLKRYFPHYPEGFVLIGFRPRWLEVAAPNVASKKDTWQPQGIAV